MNEELYVQILLFLLDIYYYWHILITYDNLWQRLSCETLNHFTDMHNYTIIVLDANETSVSICLYEIND